MNEVLIASRDSWFSTLHLHCFGPLKDAILQVTSWNMAYVKSFDASAQNFVWVVYSVFHKDVKEVCW
jgi:hypothetical protein